MTTEVRVLKRWRLTYDQQQNVPFEGWDAGSDGQPVRKEMLSHVITECVATEREITAYLPLLEKAGIRNLGLEDLGEVDPVQRIQERLSLLQSEKELMKPRMEEIDRAIDKLLEEFKEHGIEYGDAGVAPETEEE